MIKIGKFISARRTSVFALHRFDHGRRARAVLVRRNEPQRRALWVRKIDGIADAQRRLKINAAAGCRQDVAVIGAALFALATSVLAIVVEKLLNDIDAMRLQPGHIRRTGSADLIAVRLGNTPRVGCGVSKAIGSTPCYPGDETPTTCGICNLNAAPLPRLK
jgi:hypothetical protein